MAAYREGMHLVLIPKANTPDLYEIDDTVKNALSFKPVATLAEVLHTVLLPLEKRSRSSHKKTLLQPVVSTEQSAVLPQ